MSRCPTLPDKVLVSLHLTSFHDIGAGADGSEPQKTRVSLRGDERWKVGFVWGSAFGGMGTFHLGPTCRVCLLSGGGHVADYARWWVARGASHGLCSDRRRGAADLRRVAPALSMRACAQRGASESAGPTAPGGGGKAPPSFKWGAAWRIGDGDGRNDRER